MADLTFSQKYPDSWRIDHPNFGDVQRTSYVVGVIKDFKILQDDPLEVTSLVKVEVDGEEFEDYIPIFYHPKEHYWDSTKDNLGQEVIPTTEYDEENQYFKKAWMSYRCGDEVVVMMRAADEDSELEPVMVMGFADGVPRVGESLFRIMGKERSWWEFFNDDFTEAYNPPIEHEGDPKDYYYYFYPSLQDHTYNDDITGYGWWGAFARAVNDSLLPEGFDKEKQVVSEEGFKIVTYFDREEEFYNGWYFTGEDREAHCCDDTPQCISPNIYYNYYATFTSGRTYENFYRYDCYWRVGPLIFCWRFSKSYTIFDGTTYLAYWKPNSCLECWPLTPPSASRPVFSNPGPFAYGDWNVDPNTLDFTTVTVVDHYGVAEMPDEPGTFHSWWEWPPGEMYDYSLYSSEYEFYFAVYTPELWENPDHTKMIRQENDLYYNARCPQWIWQYLDPETIKSKVPAHTKEEMQAAGLWPEES